MLICGGSCTDGSVGWLSVERAVVGEIEVGWFDSRLNKPERLLWFQHLDVNADGDRRE